MCEFTYPDGTKCCGLNSYERLDGSRYCRLHKTSDMHTTQVSHICNLCTKTATYTNLDKSKVVCGEHKNEIEQKFYIRHVCPKCRKYHNGKCNSKRTTRKCDMPECKEGGRYTYGRSVRCFDHSVVGHRKPFNICNMPECSKKIEKDESKGPEIFCTLHKDVSKLIVSNVENRLKLESLFKNVEEYGIKVPILEVQKT